MTAKPLVFVSSTSDLAAERQALAAELRPLYDLYLYEEDRARGTSPERRCREQIERCHVFVGVLGGSYGTPFPGDAGGRSIVEWEFDTARAGRADLEIMPFVRRGADAAGDPRQRAFLARLTDFETGMWCKFFDSSESLVREARRSLESWLVEFWGRMQKAQLGASVRLHRLLLPAVALLVAALLAVTLTPLRSLFTDASLIALGITLGAIVLLALVLLIAETGGRRT